MLAEPGSPSSSSGPLSPVEYHRQPALEREETFAQAHPALWVKIKETVKEASDSGEVWSLKRLSVCKTHEDWHQALHENQRQPKSFDFVAFLRSADVHYRAYLVGYLKWMLSDEKAYRLRLSAWLDSGRRVENFVDQNFSSIDVLMEQDGRADADGGLIANLRSFVVQMGLSVASVHSEVISDEKKEACAKRFFPDYQTRSPQAQQDAKKNVCRELLGTLFQAGNFGDVEKALLEDFFGNDELYALETISRLRQVGGIAGLEAKCDALSDQPAEVFFQQPDVDFNAVHWEVLFRQPHDAIRQLKSTLQQRPNGEEAMAQHIERRELNGSKALVEQLAAWAAWKDIKKNIKHRLKEVVNDMITQNPQNDSLSLKNLTEQTLEGISHDMATHRQALYSYVADTDKIVDAYPLKKIEPVLQPVVRDGEPPAGEMVVELFGVNIGSEERENFFERAIRRYAEGLSRRYPVGNEVRLLTWALSDVTMDLGTVDTLIGAYQEDVFVDSPPIADLLECAEPRMTAMVRELMERVFLGIERRNDGEEDRQLIDSLTTEESKTYYRTMLDLLKESFRALLAYHGELLSRQEWSSVRQFFYKRLGAYIKDFPRRGRQLGELYAALYQALKTRNSHEFVDHIEYIMDRINPRWREQSKSKGRGSLQRRLREVINAFVKTAQELPSSQHREITLLSQARRATGRFQQEVTYVVRQLVSDPQRNVNKQLQAVLEENEQLREDKEAQAQEIATLQASKDSQASRIDELERQAREAAEQRAGEKAIQDGEMAELKQTVAGQNETVAGQNETIAGLKQTNVEQNETIARLKQTNVEQNETIAGLKQTNVEQDAKIERLTTAVEFLLKEKEQQDKGKKQQESQEQPRPAPKASCSQEAGAANGNTKETNETSLNGAGENLSKLGTFSAKPPPPPIAEQGPDVDKTAEPRHPEPSAF